MLSLKQWALATLVALPGNHDGCLPDLRQRLPMKLALILFALAAPALAADTAASTMIKDLEGVYKHQFEQTIAVAGKPSEKSTVEDVVEIMRHDDNHLYIRIAIHAGNGHRCKVQGIAGLEGSAFVYRDPEPPLSGEQCTLSVARKGDQLVVTDRIKPNTVSTCSASCGARSSLGEYTIAADKKTPIAAARVKGSKEYGKAVKAYEEMQR